MNQHNHTAQRPIQYYGRYTIWFLLLMAGIFLPFLAAGRSMVWLVDGRSQYFPQMVYLRRYLLELFRNLLQGRWNIRYYDFTIGMGDGILVAARLDRLDVLCAFVPLKLLGVFYTFLVVLRLYLSGIAFSMYCRFRRLEDRAVLIGSIVYLSGNFAIQRVPVHPFFGVAMIILPMMFLGVEKILEKENGIWMVLVTAVSFTVSYYFSYMCTIAVAFYFLLRWLQLCMSGAGGRRSVGDFFRKGFHVLGAWIVGLCMMAWLLVPSISHLLSSDRVQVEKTGSTILVYPLKHIANLVLGLISPDFKLEYNTFLGYIALVIPVLVILFSDRTKELLALRLALILEFAGLVCPIAGLVMGAFGNISNRWTFILGFTLAYASVIVVQNGAGYGRGTVFFLCAVTVLYTLGTLAVFLLGSRLGISPEYRMKTGVGCVCLIAATGIILLLRKKEVLYGTCCRVLFGTAFVFAVVTGLATNLPVMGNAASAFMTWEELPSWYESQPEKALNGLTGDPFCRADTGLSNKAWMNNALYHDYHGIAEFMSIMHSGLQHYLLELENPGIVNSVRNMSMDGRAVCENLASVHYYLAESRDGMIPYGFEKIRDVEDGRYALYENQIPLNTVYAYDAVLPYSEYSKLSAAGKQQAMMKAVVLDDEVMSGIPSFSLKTVSSETDEIRSTVRKEEIQVHGDARVNDSGYDLGQDGTLTFPIRRMAGYECYLRLSELSYEDAKASGDNQSLSITSGRGTKKLYLNGPDDAYYIPMDGRMEYLGYSDEDASDEICVRQNGKGRCSIAALEMVYLPMDSYRDDVGKRNAGGCRTPAVSANKMEGDLEDGEDRFVVAPVLYSDSWSAEVDGKPVRLVCANRCYLGFFVQEGAHHFALTYTPPHFRMALIITALAWAVFILTIVISSVRRKRPDAM